MQDGLNTFGAASSISCNEICMFRAHLRRDAIDNTNGFLDWQLSRAVVAVMT